MSILNSTSLQHSLLLAGTLSLYPGTAQAQTGAASASAAPAMSASAAPNPEGRAGVATLCIEKRSYVDPVAKKIITPTIYIETMPPEGIDTGYVPGNAVAKQWEDFLNPTDPERKKWLEDTDIPDQAKEAIDLVKRLDKNKDGIVSPKEFEDGEHGKSLEDKKIDLAFLTSLRCDNLFFTEGALNKVDPEKFPEVVGLRKDLGDAHASLRSLEGTHTATLSELDASRKKSRDLLYATIGLGGLSVLLGVGLVVALRRKKAGPTPDAKTDGKSGQRKTEETPKKNPATPPPLPKTESDKGAKVEVTIHNNPPAKVEVKTSGTPDTYGDVLQNLEGGAPNADVLNALEDEKTPDEKSGAESKPNQDVQQPAQLDPSPAQSGQAK